MFQIPRCHDVAMEYEVFEIGDVFAQRFDYGIAKSSALGRPGFGTLGKVVGGVLHEYGHHMLPRRRHTRV